MNQRNFGSGFPRRDFLRAGLGAGAGVALFSGCGATASGGFPQRPIELVVPYSPGGSTSQVGQALSSTFQLDTQLNIKNREGGNGTIGAAEVADAKPDGYTLIIVSNGVFSTEPALREVQYTLDDFVGITGLTEEPAVLAVPADSPWKNLDQLLNTPASKQPLVIGQSGAGSWLRLAHDALYHQAGVKVNNVPFKGGAPATQALLGKEIVSLVTYPSESRQQVQAGKVRYLGVFSEKRSELIPEVPTMREQGFDLSINVTKSLLGPSGIPDEDLKTLRNAFKKTQKAKEYTQFLESNYLVPRETPGSQVVADLKGDLRQAQKLIKELGLNLSQS